jgi:uncharacterized LabA/DUF88 family protein
MADRAIVFVDGNNWYHSLRAARVGYLGRLNYASISRKLLGPRIWAGTRYYVGQVRQEGSARLYAQQRRFLAHLAATDRRISVHLGRLEPRPFRNEAVDELRRYLGRLEVRIDKTVFQELMALAAKHSRSEIFVEKAVDVMIAVDMVTMAYRDDYDAAYLLSADGDFTPVVGAVTALGKRVYAASTAHGAELAASVSAFIRLASPWFADCYDQLQSAGG